MSERNYLEIMHQYCKDVQTGVRIAGKFEKLAVKRFLNDLKRQENDHDFPYSFSEERMNHVCSFIENRIGNGAESRNVAGGVHG